MVVKLQPRVPPVTARVEHRPQALVGKNGKRARPFAHLVAQLQGRLVRLEQQRHLRLPVVEQPEPVRALAEAVPQVALVVPRPPLHRLLLRRVVVLAALGLLQLRVQRLVAKAHAFTRPLMLAVEQQRTAVALPVDRHEDWQLRLVAGPPLGVDPRPLPVETSGAEVPVPTWPL